MVRENKVCLLGIHYFKSFQIYIGLLGFSKNFRMCFHRYQIFNHLFFLTFKSHLYILQMFKPKYFLFHN